MPHELEIWVPNPMADGRLGASEEVVDDGYFVAKKHKSVHEMRAHETSASGDQNALALARREQLHRGEARKGCI